MIEIKFMMVRLGLFVKKVLFKLIINSYLGVLTIILAACAQPGRGMVKDYEVDADGPVVAVTVLMCG